MTVVREADIDDAFVRVGAEWTVDEARELLAVSRADHAIVQRGAAFFAWLRTKLLAVLAGKPGTVGEALPVAPPSPVVAHPTEDDRGAVVVRDGDLLGIAKAPRPWHSGLESLAVEPRNLGARAPARIAVGKTVSLIVLITRDTMFEAMKLDVAIGDKIELALMADGAVDIAGDDSAVIEIDTDEEVSRLFHLRGREVGAGSVTIRAYKGGRSIGKIAVATTVAEVVGDAPEVERRQRIYSASPPADLDINIFERPTARAYTMELSTKRGDLVRRPFGPIVLTDNAKAIIDAYYADIEALLALGETTKEKRNRLVAKGTYLAEQLMSVELRRQLWELRGRIRTVQIHSAEPWVPWELCVLMKDNPNGGVETVGDFLAAELRVTRWLTDRPAPTELTMRSVGLVVPPDSGLVSAAAERAYMEGLVNSDRSVTPIRPKRIDLYGALESRAYDVLHFAGHGTVDVDDADRSAIHLQNGGVFTPADVTGYARNFGEKRPLVFLNACTVGRSGLSLGGIGGWPQCFIKAGSAAFIAPLWKVADTTAAQFSAAFYDSMLAGNAVSEAVFAARQAVGVVSDPTWLAYVAYAHPDAKLVS